MIHDIYLFIIGNILDFIFFLRVVNCNISRPAPSKRRKWCLKVVAKRQGRTFSQFDLITFKYNCPYLVHKYSLLFNIIIQSSCVLQRNLQRNSCMLKIVSQKPDSNVEKKSNYNTKKQVDNPDVPSLISIFYSNE